VKDKGAVWWNPPPLGWPRPARWPPRSEITGRPAR